MLSEGLITAEGEVPKSAAIHADLVELGLEKYALELEMFGVTCVPPEANGVTPEFIDRIRNAILNVATKRLGVDLVSEDYRTTTIKMPSDYVGNHWWLLYEDDAFAELAVNRASNTLVRYLLGSSAVLTQTGFLAKPSDPESSQKLRFHTDQADPPGTTVQSGINVSLLCTDYFTLEDGPTIFVPGSHKWGRGPMPYERDPGESPVPYIAARGKAGSMLIFAGGTWHGSLPRTAPGLRIAAQQLYARRHVRPNNLHDEPEAEALMDRVPGLDRVIGRRDYQMLLPTKQSYRRQGLEEHFFNLTQDPYN